MARALRWQRRGHRFESDILHKTKNQADFSRVVIPSLLGDYRTREIKAEGIVGFLFCTPPPRISAANPHSEKIYSQ